VFWPRFKTYTSWTLSEALPLWANLLGVLCTVETVANTNSFLLYMRLHLYVNSPLNTKNKNGMVKCDTWQVRSNYLFAPGNSTATSSERFAFLHNQNDKKHSQLSLFIICRHNMSSKNRSQHLCTFSLNILKTLQFPSNVHYSVTYTVLNLKIKKSAVPESRMWFPTC
jgi:hypothetical protein